MSVKLKFNLSYPLQNQLHANSDEDSECLSSVVLAKPDLPDT